VKDYYIFQNCKLDADEHVLRISGEKKRRLPVEEIAGLHLLAGYTMTSGVIELAGKHNFAIHAYNYYGIYRGTFFPPPVQPTGAILIGQVRSRLDEERRIGIARDILRTANRSANSLLSQFELEVPPEIEGETVQELLLSEARFRKEYYALLDTSLPPFWSIVKRGRRPPRRPADAVLGFSNGLLYAKMAGWIHRAGLDPRISYIHGESRARNPLALDLAEVMKASLSEGVLLEVAASGAERALITDVGDGVYLNEKGRKTVIQCIEKVLKRSTRPEGRERENTIETWGRSVPRKLHRCLVTGTDPDLPVIPCTLSSSTMQTLTSDRTYVPS